MTPLVNIAHKIKLVIKEDKVMQGLSPAFGDN